MCVNQMYSYYCIVNGLSVKNILYLAFHFVEIVLANTNFLDLKLESFQDQSFQIRSYFFISLPWTNKLIKITIFIYGLQGYLCFRGTFLSEHTFKCKAATIDGHDKILSFFMGHRKVHPYLNRLLIFFTLTDWLSEEFLFFHFISIWIEQWLGDFREFYSHLSIVLIVFIIGLLSFFLFAIFERIFTFYFVLEWIW